MLNTWSAHSYPIRCTPTLVRSWFCKDNNFNRTHQQTVSLTHSDDWTAKTTLFSSRKEKTPCCVQNTALSLTTTHCVFLDQAECISMKSLLWRQLFNTNAGRFFHQLVRMLKICEIWRDFDSSLIINVLCDFLDWKDIPEVMSFCGKNLFLRK